jgi:flavin-dependent dehydrogenase
MLPKEKKWSYLAVERRVSDHTLREKLDSMVIIDIGRVSSGFGWIFPHSGNPSIGLAGLKGRDKQLRSKLDSLLKNMNVHPGTIKPPVLSHANNSFVGRMQQLTDPGAVLAGEAGGLTDPFLGEGIYYAIRSAQLTARYVVEYMNGTQNAFARYEHHIAREFYREFRWAASLARLVYLFPYHFFRLLANRPQYIEILFKILRGEECYNNLYWKAWAWMVRRMIPCGLIKTLS